MTFVPATLLSDPPQLLADLVALQPRSPSTALDGRGFSSPTALVSNAEIIALRARIDTQLRECITSQRADYLTQPVFAGLYGDMTEFVCRPGKRLRALLFLLAHSVFDLESNFRLPTLGNDDPLLGVAVSLELLHGFILVHDDIIDRAETRRGLPTLHRMIEGQLSTLGDRSRAGRNLALVLGDILFALAQRGLLEAHLPAGMHTKLGSLLMGCMVETGFGEAADIVHGARDVAKVNLAEIEQMYSLKTTRYTIECPLMMAAVLRDVDAAGQEALSRIAQPAGLAFQIQNDLKEFARFEVSDVEVPADILEGKKTLLVRAAFDLLGESDQGLLQLCLSAGTATDATVSKVRELVTKSGAMTALTIRMNELFLAADEAIKQSPFALPIQAGLVQLIDLVRGMAAGC